MPGRENQGYGNCSYESVIFNINDRSCFSENLLMSPDYYRRIWNIDMMNKMIEKENPWNPGLSKEQIREGFTELMESGIYERPFFGDMMLAGIACGIRKRILIFNTHERTMHDPISVIDPADYGGSTDSDIPVVVAYNLVHYESLHTVESKDVDETIKLVESYIARPSRYGAEYGFSREDMNTLIEMDVEDIAQDHVSNECDGFMQRKDTNNDLERNPGSFEFGGVLFKELSNGRIKCGVCQTDCIRLVVHLNNNNRCSGKFDMSKLRTEYSKYRSRIRGYDCLVDKFIYKIYQIPITLN